jgi:ABC-type Fe3+ transport system permease subunit
MLRKSGATARTLWVLICTFIGVVVVFPFAVAIWTCFAGVLGRSGNEIPGSWPVVPSLNVVAQTILWPLSIAVGAVLIAWPIAWHLGRSSRPWRAWLLVPLTMPTYLAYAGYGLLRSPGSWLGDWLETVGREHWRDAPFLAGQGLAWLGLVLWSWPITAGVLMWGVRGLDPTVEDALAIDGRSRLQRAWTRLLLIRGTVLSAIAIVTLIMLGSAIPLHLAQVESWALKLWLALDSLPRHERWRVWVLASPLMLIAVCAGWWISGWAVRGDIREDHSARERNKRAGLLRNLPACWMWAVWSLATLIPLGLFAWSIRDRRTLIDFWRINPDAMGWSLVVASLCGGIAAGLAAVVWQLLAERRGQRVLRILITILAASGLAPGVIVGAIVNEAWNQSTWQQPVADSVAIIVLAHLARFAWIGALAGAILAALEPRERSEQRAVDGDRSLRGWWLVSGRPAIGALVGTGIVVGLLSFHEIESSVMVQPPGIDGLSRRILQFLHFSQMDDLSAAGVWLVGGGVCLSLLAGWLGGRWWDGWSDRPGKNQRAESNPSSSKSVR